MIGVAFFVYLKFDSIWTGVRGTLHPGTLWSRAFGPARAGVPEPSVPAWSADSTEFTLDCPRGLHACCDGAPAGGAGICRQAGALVAKAQARRLLGTVAPGSPMRLVAKAGVSATGLETFDLTLVQGRGEESRGSTFALRRNASGIWCDGQGACLADPSPQPPLLFGRPLGGSENAPETRGAARWVSGTAAVHPVLPGRILTVDSVTGGVRIRIYHGGELYSTYEPVQAAGNPPKPGTAVTVHSVLGEAPWLSAGYTILLRVRRAGINLDPADFFRVQPLAAAEPADSAAAGTP